MTRCGVGLNDAHTLRPGMSEPIREEPAAHSGATYSPTFDVQTYMYDTPVRQQLA